MFKLNVKQKWPVSRFLQKKKKKRVSHNFLKVSWTAEHMPTRALPVGLFDSLIIEQLLIPDIGG